MPAFSLTPVQGFPEQVSEEFPLPLAFAHDSVPFAGPIQLVDFIGGTVTESEDGTLTVHLGGGGGGTTITAGLGITVTGDTSAYEVATNLVAGNNITLTPGTGNSLIISATGGSGGPCGTCEIQTFFPDEYGMQYWFTTVTEGEMSLGFYNAVGINPANRHSAFTVDFEGIEFESLHWAAPGVRSFSFNPYARGASIPSGASAGSLAVEIDGDSYLIPYFTP